MLQVYQTFLFLNLIGISICQLPYPLYKTQEYPQNSNPYYNYWPQQSYWPQNPYLEYYQYVYLCQLPEVQEKYRYYYQRIYEEQQAFYNYQIKIEQAAACAVQCHKQPSECSADCKTKIKTYFGIDIENPAWIKPTTQSIDTTTYSQLSTTARTSTRPTKTDEGSGQGLYLDDEDTES